MMDAVVPWDEVVEKSAHLCGFTEQEEAAICRLALPR